MVGADECAHELVPDLLDDSSSMSLHNFSQHDEASLDDFLRLSIAEGFVESGTAGDISEQDDERNICFGYGLTQGLTRSFESVNAGCIMDAPLAICCRSS